MSGNNFSGGSNTDFGVLVGYGLLIAGLFTGVFWFIGAIWAMIKKGDADNSVSRSHYGNMIKTFWWSILFYIIGFVLSVIYIGYLIIAVTWVWTIYRIVKGLAKVTSNLPYS